MVDANSYHLRMNFHKLYFTESQNDTLCLKPKKKLDLKKKTKPNPGAVTWGDIFRRPQPQPTVHPCPPLRAKSYL